MAPWKEDMIESVKKNHFKTIWGGKFVIFWIWKFWKFKSIIVLHFLQYLCFLFLFGIHFGVIMGVWSLSLRCPKQTAEAKLGGPMLQATSLNELEPIILTFSISMWEKLIGGIQRNVIWSAKERFHSYTLSLKEKLTNGFGALAIHEPQGWCTMQTKHTLKTSLNCWNTG